MRSLIRTTSPCSAVNTTTIGTRHGRSVEPSVWLAKSWTPLKWHRHVGGPLRHPNWIQSRWIMRYKIFQACVHGCTCRWWNVVIRVLAVYSRDHTRTWCVPRTTLISFRHTLLRMPRISKRTTRAFIIIKFSPVMIIIEYALRTSSNTNRNTNTSSNSCHRNCRSRTCCSLCDTSCSNDSFLCECVKRLSSEWTLISYMNLHPTQWHFQETNAWVMSHSSIVSHYQEQMYRCTQVHLMPQLKESLQTKDA